MTIKKISDKLDKLAQGRPIDVTPSPKPVLVTTEFRGVFFGYLLDGSKLPAEVTLGNARNCIKWTESVGGFLGLAATGPDHNCLIGARVDELTLYKITSIAPVSEQAAKAWTTA